MKKFISMVMAAAMVVSLVPATAFAATGHVYSDGTAYVIRDLELAEDFTDYGLEGFVDQTNAPELQIEIDDIQTEKSGGTDTGLWDADITITLENADFAANDGTLAEDIYNDTTIVNFFKNRLTIGNAVEGTDYTLTVEDWSNNSVTLNIAGDVSTANAIVVGDFITLDLQVMVDDTDAGSVATVSVESEIIGADAEDLVFIEIVDEGITAELKKVAEVAEDEAIVLEKNLVIESNVGKFADDQTIKLELTNGFEFCDLAGSVATYATGIDAIKVDVDDDDVLYLRAENVKKITLKPGLFKVDAVDAKAGDVCEIKVTALEDDYDDMTLEVANAIEGKAAALEAVKVVSDVVTMELDDADEDVPVFYSGVDVANTGLNDNSDHKSLKVKISESTAAALDDKKAFTLTLPEGVYATDVDVTGTDDVVLSTMVGSEATDGEMETAFKTAYEKGEYETFEFARKTFADSTAPFEFYFVMTLIAEPGFVGDVTLTLDGAGFEEAQEVVIAKFEAPFTVEAAQNDVIIDYRNTEIPTDIVVKEAEAELWDDATGKKMTFQFGIDKLTDNGNDIFEDDAVYTVNEESEMEITEAKDGVGFTVKEESEDEAAVITINNISLYMARDIAAGAYDLTLGVDKAEYFYAEELFTAEKTAVTDATYGLTAGSSLYTVADVLDYVDGTDLDVPAATVKEGFVNVITAGRDKDDASFTKKVVVPVGESYIIAGEETVALDVPAYINANGYTMLPVRAVATALGINTNNVIWSQAAKQVTILYGQRIITMTVGQAVVYVNGSAIPATAAVEVVDGRAFLGMRDLANALGVTTIAWDPATQTATLN